MANMISWEKPLTQTSWTHTKVERSATLAGVYTEIGSVAIATSYYFDIDGTSTNYYKIRFYDSSALTYSDYSTPIIGTTDTDVFSHTVKAVTILGTLGAIGPDSNNDYSIFGMKLNQTVAESIVEQVYDYTAELIGDDAMTSTDTSTIRKIKGFVSAYSALKILDVLNGIAITTHFNYSSGGLNVQKPVIGQMAAMTARYSKETNKWRRLILTRGKVNSSTDLQLTLINEVEPSGSGIQRISYDFPGT